MGFKLLKFINQSNTKWVYGSIWPILVSEFLCVAKGTRIFEFTFLGSSKFSIENEEIPLFNEKQFGNDFCIEFLW